MSHLQFSDFAKKKTFSLVLFALIVKKKLGSVLLHENLEGFSNFCLFLFCHEEDQNGFFRMQKVQTNWLREEC